MSLMCLVHAHEEGCPMSTSGAKGEFGCDRTMSPNDPKQASRGPLCRCHVFSRGYDAGGSKLR